MASWFEPPVHERNHALRITLAYDGHEVRAVDVRELDMLAPPSDAIYDHEPASGFWCELRDDAGNLRYRRVMHDPMGFSVEAPSGEPGRPFSRVAQEKPRGQFSIVVPRIDGCHVLLLCSSPPGDPAAPAKAFARVDLRGRGPQTPDQKEKA